jgi:hypothetical protein
MGWEPDPFVYRAGPVRVPGRTGSTDRFCEPCFRPPAVVTAKKRGSATAGDGTRFSACSGAPAGGRGNGVGPGILWIQRLRHRGRGAWRGGSPCPRDLRRSSRAVSGKGREKGMAGVGGRDADGRRGRGRRRPGARAAGTCCLPLDKATEEGGRIRAPLPCFSSQPACSRVGDGGGRADGGRRSSPKQWWRP